MAREADRQSRYKSLVEKIFLDRYARGSKRFEFEREDLVAAAKELGIDLPKNLGDVIYSIRYRTPMPDSVIATQPQGVEWIIEGTGRSRYAFVLVAANRIVPNPALLRIKIPDATPEIVGQYALTDEQALLARVRYNRLLDIFLGLATFSLQNHLRTTVRGIGQIEIDEIYIGVDSAGRQFVLPVQAKGGSDQLSVVQAKQDFRCCAEKYPNLICRVIAAQFMDNDLIAMFELFVDRDDVRIMREAHYWLVASEEISALDLRNYADRA
jgi:hypothetical protein